MRDAPYPVTCLFATFSSHRGHQWYKRRVKEEIYIRIHTRTKLYNRDRGIELLAESMDANLELASDDPWAPFQETEN